VWCASLPASSGAALPLKKSDRVDVASPVKAGRAAAIFSTALLAFAATFRAVTPDHPACLQFPMAAGLTVRPCALNALATLRRLGCSRLSQTALASAGVGLSVLGAFATPGHPCFFHRVM